MSESSFGKVAQEKPISDKCLFDKQAIHQSTSVITKSRLWTIFSWATALDCFLIITGLICSIFAGLGIPAINYLLGDIINTLINFVSATSVDPLSAPAQEKLFWTEMMYSLTLLVVLGIIIAITAYLMMAFLDWSAARQCYRLKIDLFSSLLGKEIAFFDKHAVGELVGRSMADLALVQDGLSQKMGMVILHTSTCISCFIVAFFRCWQLTLVLCIVVPVLGGVGSFFMYMLSQMAEKVQALYARASAHAGEILAGIRTIISFEAQSSEYEHYKHLVQEAGKKNGHSFLVFGASIGVVWMVIFFLCSLVLWTSAKFIESGIIVDRGIIVSILFSVISGSFAVGHIFQNFEAVNKGATASVSLSRLIKENEPQQITSFNEPVKNEDLVRIRGLIERHGITFDKVTFRYV